MAQKPKVAVVGLGNIGTAVTGNLIKGCGPVIIADREIEKAKGLAKKLGNLVQPKEIVAAIKKQI